MTEHPAHGTLRPVTRYASVLLAHNPSPMTLEGTNTWVVGEPGAAGRVVIDPGPEDADHLRRVADHGPVSLVLLTHHHPDHTDGVARFVELTGAPVRALDPALCRDGEPLRDGEVVEAGGVELRVLATPGHTADSVCFVVDGDEPAVFTGDSVLGRGTTVVAHPDGHLGSYLESLRRLADLPEGLRVLPGHGPDLPDARTVAEHYLQHRHQRLDQVRAALADLGPDATPRQVVEVVYADVDRSVWPAADLTVQAQLTYLRETA
ncbi:MBL fold metallo-hydrolase [Saccharopolyspora hordei]|uniref:Glyoxylase-like metal-dependent hydrolase (Beta-lactamase superfamily II) n=1 Tax=Saccharopolyspora hordei TaxID=1838 RepID=A0A853ABJ2_9PSEU|nr:MBL fold metallo-hydrolase [Saccharopolyspora hordei]NYI81772.1 glyoxylase-like metal-dependent hydrolase (beta-lactamase superfamily II) [Saccharopolyspora hordei]